MSGFRKVAGTNSGEFRNYDGDVSASTSQDGTAEYAYDGDGQLLTATYTTNPNQTQPADESYAYDSNGNRPNPGATPAPVLNNQPASDGTYDYAYDNEGNLITRTDIATGAVTKYAWDNRNRLTEVTSETASGTVTQTVNYYYDPENRLIAETVTPASGTATTKYYTYDGDEIVLAFSATGAGATSLTDRYLWGPAVDQILADEQVTSPSQAGTVLWPLSDNAGSVRDIAQYNATTGTTTVIEHRVYDSFGNLVSPANSAVDFLFGYAGQMSDSATGLENDLNRWYDPHTGRFLSEDPSGFAGGDANLYRYAKNNPLTHTDPTGLFDEGFVDDSELREYFNKNCDSTGMGLIVSVFDPIQTFLFDRARPIATSGTL
jgi:RHS repeat-associated protein